jgi:hypothetical protein
VIVVGVELVVVVVGGGAGKKKCEPGALKKKERVPHRLVVLNDR